MHVDGLVSSTVGSGMIWGGWCTAPVSHTLSLSPIGTHSFSTVAPGATLILQHSLVAQCIKDLVWSLLSCGFDSWLGNLRGSQTNKKQTKDLLRENECLPFQKSERSLEDTHSIDRM